MNKIDTITFQDKELQKLYDELPLDSRRKIANLIHSGDIEGLLKDFKNVHDFFFIKKPPTPEEFLDWRNGWLPKTTSEMIFPEVKKIFIEMLNPSKLYSNLVNYGATRTGKSFLERLLIVYTIVYLHHLRSINDFYGIPTNPTIFLLSFKLDKARQLLMRPIFDIIEKSPNFIRVHNQNAVKEEQKKYGVNKIVYSHAAMVGEITLSSGLQIVLGNSDVLSFIGNDMISLFISEIAYFIEHTGTTEENIFRLYTDGIARINATFGKKKFAWVYLDTSANNADSLIENFILNELRHRKGTYFNQMRQWDVKTQDRVPDYLRTGETFKVITGKGTIPPKLDPTPEEISKAPPELVMDVPIDYYEKFEDNLIKSIKDIAGVPTSSTDKFIPGTIIERIFHPDIENIIGPIEIDSMDDPNKLLWNKIKDQFFALYDGTNYTIKRAASEPRYIGLDIATSNSGDIMGLTVGHWEWSIQRSAKIWVCDFTLPLVPGKNGISIDAWKNFILDLHNESGMPINGISSDTKESKEPLQFLKRNNLNFVEKSVDKNLEAYEYLKIMLQNDYVKAGKNIFLKNNLVNLEKNKIEKKTQKGQTRVVEKIDHPTGETNNIYNGNWEKSTCGYFAKDVSDSLAQALYLSYLENPDYQPTAIYERENEKVARSKKLIIPGHIDSTEDEEDEIYDSMMNAMTPFDLSL